MNLNQELASMYDGNEDLQKQAQAELFSKLAAAQGIDLNSLTNDQINELWDHTWNKKTAEEQCPPGEKKDEHEEAKKEEEEKKEAASREHATKVAAAQEEQRAHDLGVIMANSYLNHLQKVAEAREAEAEKTASESAEQTKEATMPPKAMAFGKAIDKVKSVAGGAAKNPHARAGAAGAAGAAAGFAAGRAGKKKEGSATDALALEYAVKLASEAGLDVEEVADRVAAVHTLGLGDSDKVASTVDQQVHIRALEYLEAAGYPVDWQ